MLIMKINQKFKLLIILMCTFLVLHSCQERLKEDTNTTIDHSVHELVNTIKTFTSYNYWANSEYVKWLKEKDSSIFYDSIPSSFTTIKENIIHLWRAEIGWLQTLKGETWDVSKYEVEDKSIFQILDEFKNKSKELEQFIQDSKPEDLVRDISLSNGNPKFNEILIHVLNHASYHRGQIVTIARNLGLTDPPRTDFIYFINSIN